TKLKAAKRQIDDAGMASLMAALGSDLAELNAGVDQLIEDTEGTITAEIVDRYYGGRVEATGFKVADAAVSGDAKSALSLLRHALSTGSDPVPLVAAVAMKLRGMAKVQGFSGSSGELAAELKMAPWQVDRARREVRRWNEVALGQSLIAAAEADEAVKGGGRDPVYA
ncbi:DNA polymerase III subunit delta, partial [Burkholderia multivorans]